MAAGRKRAGVGFLKVSAICVFVGLAGCLRPTPPVAALPPAPAISAERAAAIAEIRAEAAAGDAMPYPDAFQSEQTMRLAARGEPLSSAAVDAIEAELAAIAARRASATSAREIASLEARARELRRIAGKGAQPAKP